MSDDVAVRRTVGLELRRALAYVHEADSEASAIAIAKVHRIDLALFDDRLQGINGLDAARAFVDVHAGCPWILMSGAMTVSIAVDAMRLGAANAVPFPFDIDAVVLPALDIAVKRHTSTWPRLPLSPRLPAPKSAAERWAYLVLRACDASDDLKTLQAWASFVGVSLSGLTQSCRIVGIRPREARDLVRILRILFHSGGRTDSVESQLDVSDQRTLRTLLADAGLTGGSRPEVLTLQEFLSHQDFIVRESRALSLLLSMLPDQTAEPEKRIGDARSPRRSRPLAASAPGRASPT